MRIVSWNIRAGGGRRADAIVERLAGWDASVVLLSEFRCTPPSLSIASALTELGFLHQHSLATPLHPARNSLLLASRFPLRITRAHRAPRNRDRWLLAEVLAPEPFSLGGMHIPNEVSGIKFPYLDAVAALAEAWRRGPALFLGDTNSGRPIADEENPVFSRRYSEWFDRVEGAGFRDAFRHLHGDRREFTWYSPNGGNGFRIDEAFANLAICRRLVDVRHEWATVAGRRDALSDHAALIVDLA